MNAAANSPTLYTHTGSPLGQLLLVSDDGRHLTGLYMSGQQYERHPGTDWQRADHHPVLAQAKSELEAYFDGHRQDFTVPLLLQGSDFQRRVWALLLDIPYGATSTYGAIAQAVGDPLAARTVGHAIGLNPISIIVPCHRVVAASGALTGYNGGLDRKRRLLDLESGRLQLL